MSDQKKQINLCRFCGREIKFLYYCEDCGVTCCSDCLRDDFNYHFACQDCNSKNIEHNEVEGKKICKDCGKENVIKITQHLKACPKCHSLKILNIYEKKEELEQKFLELIKSARTFIQPLKDVINELFLLRHKIKIGREPPIRCFHFPKMESELLALFKGFLYVKDNLQGKINTHFRQLALNKEYFFDIYHQPNSNVRIIENILENLVRTHDSIENFITNHIKDISEKFNGFQKNLQFVDKITKLFLPYQRFLNLAEKEKPVYAVKTRLTNGLDSEKRSKKSKGILFITNYDLSFVHEYGMLKKKQELIFKAPVDDLIKVKDKGKFFKKLFIQFEYGKYEFAFPANLVSRIIEYILLARTFQENDIFDDASAKELQDIELNLNDLIRYIEEEINSFFTLKIQYNQNITYDFNENNESYINNHPKLPPYYYYHQNQHQPEHWNPKNYPPYMTNSPVETPEDFDYYGNNFYSQNIDDPYRFQNYKPNNIHKQYRHPFGVKRSPDYDERKFLMEKLKRAQRFYNQYPPHITQERNYFEEIPPINSFDSPFDKEGFSFKDYHKNHLSKQFDPEYDAVNRDYMFSKKIYEFNKNIDKKMRELKKEKYSLKETLKKLDTKFDQGIISEIDYFKTFKNLQKEIYIIDKKIKSLNQKIKDKQFLNKNFERKGFYS